jgi:hypothetical protein
MLKYIVLLLILIPSSYAAYTQKIHDAWHYGNETFTAGPLNITLKASSDQKAVAVRFGSTTFLLYNKTCEETPSYIFCVDSTREGNFDYYWRVWRQQFKLRIESKQAKLVISRKLLQSEFFLGQQAVVTTTVKNSGSFAATAVHFEDDLPGFQVLSASTCLAADHTVVWDGNLAPDQSIQCSYTILARNQTSLQSKATASYFNGVSSATESSQATALVVYGAEVLVLLKDSYILELGQQKKLNITLNNTLPKEVFIKSLSFVIPYGIRVSNVKGLQKANDYKYSFSGTLKPRSKTMLNYSATAEQAGRYSLRLEMEYDADTQTRHLVRDISISAYSPNLSLTFDTTASPLLRVGILNPSSQPFTNVNLEISGKCLNASVKRALAELKPQSSIDIGIPTKVNASCRVDARADYQTRYGQQMRVAKYVTLTAKSAKGQSTLNATASPKNQPSSAQGTQSSPERQSMLQNIDYKTIGIAIVSFFAVLIAVMLILKRKKKLLSKEEAKAIEKESKAVPKEKHPKPEEEEKIETHHVARQEPEKPQKPAKPSKQQPLKKPKNEPVFRF